MYDVLIVGGGVIGCSVARELSRYVGKFVLIEKETIHTEEVQLLMQGKSAEDVIAYMEEKEKAADAKASTSQPPQSAQTANTSQPAGDAAQK